MTDEIKKDTVDYNDPTPFDGSKLQSISDISKAIRHKMNGEDVREPIAQQGEALVKLIQETGGNQSAEVVAARGNHELLQMREDAQDSAIVKAQSTANSKFDANQAESYLKSVTAIPETFANLNAIKAKYPNGKNGLMVAADNGHKYIWTNNAWTDVGIYQSVGIADGSISIDKLSAISQAPIFTPSRDGMPNYDSKTHILDFNCVNDNAFFFLSNEAVSVPQGTTVLDQNGLNGRSSSKLIYDTISSSFLFTAWNATLNKDQVLLGTIRKSSQGYLWSGSFDITVDGKQMDQYNVAPNVLFGISGDNVPDFNSKTRVFDFNSKEPTTATVIVGERVIQIPTGTIAEPTEKAKTFNTLRVVYNVANNTASVISWNEAVPAYCVTITTIVMNYRNHPLVCSEFPCTIDRMNTDTQKSTIEFVVSSDGAPIFDTQTNSLDLNCYNDNAYFIFDGQTYQVPKNTVIKGMGISNRSVRFLFNPDTGEFASTGWGNKLELGWVQFAATRRASDGSVLVTANFPIKIKGAAAYQSNPTVNPVDAKIKGISHRGFNKIAPEETKAAYLLSKINGYLHWEGDINWTKDNIPVMIHDSTINRIACNLDGTPLTETVKVSDLNYSDFANYNFGLVKGQFFHAAKIQTFEELVRLARYNDAYLHIEFKYEFTQDQVQQLYDTVKKYNMLDRVAWQAFGWDWLKPMMALEPDGQFELLGGAVNDDYFDKLASFKTDTNRIVASQNASLSVDQIQSIADHGYPIYLWTVDDGATVRRFRDIGMVEGIMTNGAINVADELAK